MKFRAQHYFGTFVGLAALIYGGYAIYSEEVVLREQPHLHMLVGAEAKSVGMFIIIFGLGLLFITYKDIRRSKVVETMQDLER